MQVLNTLLQQEEKLGEFIEICPYIDPELPINPCNLTTTLEGIYGRIGRNEITPAGANLKNLRGIYRLRVNFLDKNYYYYGETSSIKDRMLDRVGECTQYLRFLPTNRQYKSLLSRRYNRKLTSAQAREIFSSKVFLNTLALGKFFYGKKPGDAKKILACRIAKEFRKHIDQKFFFENHVHLSYLSLGEDYHDREAPPLLKYSTKLLESFAINEHVTEYSEKGLVNIKNEIISLPKRKERFINEYEKCCNSDSETPILQDEIISRMYNYSINADE